MQGGYSTDLDAMNIFVKNTHFIAKLRSVLKERIHLFTFQNIKKQQKVPARNMKT